MGKKRNGQKKHNNQKRQDNQKGQNSTLQSNAMVVDENTLTQAIVRAYKIIEDNEKAEVKKLEEQNDVNKKAAKEKWYIEALFILNVLFFPWRINKRFAINNRIYDGILVIVVSLILETAGFIIWGIGGYAIGYGIVMSIQDGIINGLFGLMGVGVLLMMFGSMFILGGKEFSKVSDSNRIYAYSASLIALISCIITVLSLRK